MRGHKANPVELTDEQIRKWWASENGLEDMDMAKLDDFTAVVRAVLAAAAKESAKPVEQAVKRWEMLAYMEASRVAPDTLAHYIANPDKLDYAVHLHGVHTGQQAAKERT